MHVGVLTTSYPRSPDDYAGRFVAELAGCLAGAGDEVCVLAPAPAVAEHAGVSVHPLRFSLGPPLLLGGAGAPEALFADAWSLRARAWAQVPAFVARSTAACHQRARRWDAVVSHWLLPCGVIAARAARGRPHLAIAHASDVHLLARLPARALALRALSRPRTALVLTSEALRAPLARAVAPGDRRSARLVEEATVQRMGVWLPALAPRPGLPRAGRLRVLFLGRLVPIKGLDRLIAALRGLDVELVVVGDGPQRAVLERQAREAGLTVHFAGALLGAAKQAALAAADVLVAPSIVLRDGRFDTAPVVLLEAMGAGLPVIASRVGGATELFAQGEDGLLVPPGDVAELRGAIVRLRDDVALRTRLGAAARARAEAHAWQRVADNLRGRLLALFT